ncbi:Type 1 glutamine amidotransferase-like domain-containing protein [Kitasatospora sp. NPDC059571]|uniref:Type 1 glutamine amidotransferase-like domain-containing protein n=1 Tax=Kitasatospora sp. NPDC059571 TaxID=3346871 RepID=UPI003676063E
MGIHLIGGGRDTDAYQELYGPFLAEAGEDPAVACLLLDEGDLPEQSDRWAAALTAAAPCRPFTVPILPGAGFDPAVLDAADAVFVGGGLTPAYRAALAGPLGRRLAERPLPYAGFSAGAAIASARAVVGGWLADGVPVCPEDTAEDLTEVAVHDGLGLLAPAVDVHAAQWGTLGRLAALVARGTVASGVAIDENTALTVAADGSTAVRGAGRVHLVRPYDGGAAVRSHRAGERFAL